MIQVRPEVNAAKVGKAPEKRPRPTTTTERTVFKFSRPESENRFREGIPYCWKCLQGDLLIVFGFELSIQGQ